MPLYALGEVEPQIDPLAYVHPDAVVIGNVWIGAESSVWPNAVLRGDEGLIQIGERTSIQDGSVLHCTPSWPTIVGSDCTIGHLVHLEGCTIEDGSLVGNGSIVLHRAVVRSGAVVGAGAVVRDDMDVPSGSLAVGVPAIIKPGLARAELIEGSSRAYVQRIARYRAELRRLD